MLLYDMNNNILISHPHYLGEYKDEYEKWDIYQDINIVWVGKKEKILAGTVMHAPFVIIKI